MPTRPRNDHFVDEHVDTLAPVLGRIDAQLFGLVSLV